MPDPTAQSTFPYRAIIHNADGTTIEQDCRTPGAALCWLGQNRDGRAARVRNLATFHSAQQLIAEGFANRRANP